MMEFHSFFVDWVWDKIIIHTFEMCQNVIKNIYLKSLSHSIKINLLVLSIVIILSCAGYFDLAQVIFLDLLSCYFISLFTFVFSSSWFLILCILKFCFLFWIRFYLTLVFAVPFWNLAFWFCSLIIYLGKFWFTFVCLVSLSRLVLFVIVSYPLPRFPVLWPVLPGSSSPLSRVKSLVLWVPYLAARLVWLLRFTSS